VAVSHVQPVRSSRLLTGGGVIQVRPPHPFGNETLARVWRRTRRYLRLSVTAPPGDRSPAPGRTRVSAWPTALAYQGLLVADASYAGYWCGRG
jgi:hypothetical protein